MERRRNEMWNHTSLDYYCATILAWPVGPQLSFWYLCRTDPVCFLFPFFFKHKLKCSVALWPLRSWCQDWNLCYREDQILRTVHTESNIFSFWRAIYFRKRLMNSNTIRLSTLCICETKKDMKWHIYECF